jgi:hypothetical protein
MSIPQEPDTPEIRDPNDPTLPENQPIDTPTEIPEREEAPWQAPGTDEPPMRTPRDNPDVETEI